MSITQNARSKIAAEHRLPNSEGVCCRSRLMQASCRPSAPTLKHAAHPLQQEASKFHVQ